MVERIVLMKLKDELANEGGRAEIAARLVQEIPSVTGVRGVTVQFAADDRTGKDWDLCLRVAFDAVDDVEGYRTDAGHRALIDGFLLPRLEILKAWNFASANG